LKSGVEQKGVEDLAQPFPKVDFLKVEKVVLRNFFEKLLRIQDYP
jgi:hypothetical protein